MICPGCNGKRWVDSQHKGPTTCPVCNGSGSIEETKSESNLKPKYDQDRIWTSMLGDAPRPFAQTLELELEQFIKPDPLPDPIKIIVHLLFDFPITPQGNLIYEQLRRATISGHEPHQRLNEDQLVARGYVPTEDGKVMTVDDIPVGPFYLKLDDWGVCLFKKWCMSEPITIDTNRKGNPLFMDGDMVAFMASYYTTDGGSATARCIRQSLQDLHLSVAEKGWSIINLKLVQFGDDF